MLTAKQELFVQEYLIDLNATQAAIRAGYSPTSAEVIGFDNLRKPKIAEQISFVKDARAKKTQITAEWVLLQAAEVYHEARAEKDRPNALKALDLVGRHVDVKAYTNPGEVLDPIEIARKLAFMLMHGKEHAVH